MIQNLRDFLTRWVEENEDEDEFENRMRILVVYPDNVMARLLDAFESLAVVASEAMQHQTYPKIAKTFTLTFDRLPSQVQRRAEDILCRSLSALGDHVLTTELDTSLTMLVQTLHGWSHRYRSRHSRRTNGTRDNLGQAQLACDSRSQRLVTRLRYIFRFEPRDAA